MAQVLVTADQVKLGDTISCSCDSGCRSLNLNCSFCGQGCQGNSGCGACATNSVFACSNVPKTWQQVLQIRKQPAVNSIWFIFELTGNNQWGGWAKTALTKMV
jgi:hypothetical protein